MDINLLTAEEKRQLFEDLSKEVEPSETVSAPPLKKHISCSCGFEWDIDPDVFDDMELYDALMALDDRKPDVKPILQKILGDDGQKNLYEVCRVSGKVRVTLVYEALHEIFDQFKAKNS